MKISVRFAARCGLVVALSAPIASGAQPSADTQAFDSARYAWIEGDYIESLTSLQRILGGSQADAVLDSIALLTGELYRTAELLPDGSNPRWSADGRHVLIDQGINQSYSTTVITLQQGSAVLPQTTVSGAFGAALSPDGTRLAYLMVEEDAELRAARARFDSLRTGNDGRAINEQRNRIADLERARTRVVERTLSNGRDRRLQGPAEIIPPLVYSADGRAVYAIGRQGSDIGVFALTASGAAKSVSKRGGPAALLQLLPDGKLMYLTSQRSFAILDPATGTERSFNGTGPSISADGAAIAYVSIRGDSNYVDVVRLDDLQNVRTVVRTTDPIARPAIAADGRTVVYQQLPDHDWELYIVEPDSSTPRRLTREIQHDLFPTWVSNSRVLSVLGEARHRRSYLTDPTTGNRTRLFHNNLVRTVSMEYEWVPSPDGAKLLVVAERDGNTISTERGIYLVDLTQKVTVPEVRDRVAAMLETEKELRERGQKMFAPIEAAVRDVVANVSVARIYDAAQIVHSFGSKFITEPGNRKAIEFYERKLREYGYEPELQWFEPRPGVRSANVIARLPGTVNPELIYVVSSHFDSVEDGPGADDNSSGSTALLEAARVLAGKPRPATIIFAFFTGEEAGLRGSREFVRRAVAAGDKIVGALNNDMIGWSGDAKLDNTIRYSNDGLRDLQHAAAFSFTDLITYDARYYKSTDAHAYYEAYGDIVAGIGSYPILSNPHYHQSHDILATISHRLVAEVSKTTVASLMLMASSPSRISGLTVTRSGNGAQVQWTPSPEKGIKSYEIAYGPPDDPSRRTMTSSEPRATLSGVSPGWVVRVRAVSDRGTTGWDWARAEIR